MNMTVSNAGPSWIEAALSVAENAIKAKDPMTIPVTIIRNKKYLECSKILLTTKFLIAATQPLPGVISLVLQHGKHCGQLRL